MTAPRYRVREWLNDPRHHGHAFVAAEVDGVPDRPEDASDDYIPWLHGGTLTIADCHRQVTLTFDVSPDTYENDLRKLDLLIGTLTAMRPHLVAQGALAAEYERQREERPRRPRRRRRTLRELLHETDPVEAGAWVPAPEGSIVEVDGEERVIRNGDAV
jgi:hypothetical protein